MLYNFDWDTKKAKSNLHKHKISFQRAISIFRDPNALSVPDDQHSNIEKRWHTLGIDQNGTLLVVVHTFSYDSKDICTIRVISARKATKTESLQY